VTGLDLLVAERGVLICCGSGGVGKTTIAAALAGEAAAHGRRAVVVTIDPARRLADALGVSGGLTNDPIRIDGPWDGELWAMMLDTKGTFDALVRRYAATAQQAESILANPFYRNISSALSGTQEYMAAEKLYELHEDARFDLVVVDTPPTRNALDFLDAPGRLTRFLDHRLYRVLTMPTRVGLRVANVAAQAFLRTVSRVVGGEVVADAIAFFQAFDGMEQGFRARAGAVDALLRSPATGYVLVATPRVDTVRDALFFIDRLRTLHLRPAGLVVNRVHPRFGTGSPAAARRKAAAGGPQAVLWQNLAELTEVAQREAAALEPLRTGVGDSAAAWVPLLATDVHDLDGLGAVGKHLISGPANVPRRAPRARRG
jgi:anion-transporting  ArsA/GET3 family ATPase